MGWRTTFALLAGVTLVSGDRAVAGPNTPAKPFPLCCARVSEMHQDDNSHVYAACACQHQHGVSADEPPTSQRFETLDETACFNAGHQYCHYPQGVCPNGMFESRAGIVSACAGTDGNRMLAVAKTQMFGNSAAFTDADLIYVIPNGATLVWVRMTPLNADLDMLVGHDNTCDIGDSSCSIYHGCPTTADGVPEQYTYPNAYCRQDAYNSGLGTGEEIYWSGTEEFANVPEGDRWEMVAFREVKKRDYDVRVFGVQSSTATLEYEYASLNNCDPGNLPPLGSCCDNPNVESSGDPHMKNLLGEKFDLSKEGKHLLIQLPRGSGEELEVYGNILEAKRERKCSLFFMTQLSLHGSAVGDQPVVIDVLNNRGISNLNVTVNEEEVDLNFDGTNVGKALIKACSEKEALCKLINPTRRQPSEPQKVLVSLQNGVHVVTSYYQSANPFLNIAVAGLHNMNQVGGLLGHDDHTGVGATPECSAKQSIKYNRKTSMFQLSNSATEMAMLTVGHYLGSTSKPNTC